MFGSHSHLCPKHKVVIEDADESVQMRDNRSEQIAKSEGQLSSSAPVTMSPQNQPMMFRTHDGRVKWYVPMERREEFTHASRTDGEVVEDQQSESDFFFGKDHGGAT